MAANSIANMVKMIFLKSLTYFCIPFNCTDIMIYACACSKYCTLYLNKILSVNTMKESAPNNHGLHCQYRKYLRGHIILNPGIKLKIYFRWCPCFLSYILTTLPAVWLLQISQYQSLINSRLPAAVEKSIPLAASLSYTNSSSVGDAMVSSTAGISRGLSPDQMTSLSSMPQTTVNPLEVSTKNIKNGRVENAKYQLA